MTLTVNGLSFSFAAAPVLQNVAFEAAAGECVVILGQNGVGKSTLLRCLAHLLPCRTGEILADGADIRRMKPTQRAQTVGYVAQQPAFSDETVFDAVLLGRRPYIHREATADDLALVEGLLARTGLTEFSLRRVDELSGGERQKVAVARALAQQPHMLLLDEPASNLDLRNQLDLIALLRDIAADDGIPVIVTMHDVNLALRFADKFLLMDAHSICAAGNRTCITPDILRRVFGVSVQLAEVGGHTVVVPE